MADFPTGYLKALPLALLSSLLLAFSFPDYNYGFLAWVGLVPLMIALPGRKIAFGFLSSYLCGICFWLMICHWTLSVPGYTALHHGLFALYLGSYFALFGAAFAFICRRWRVESALLAAPSLWVSLEYIRSNLSFLAHPWVLLSQSQHQYLPILQFSSLTGAWGVSFLIVSVNAALAAWFLSTPVPFLPALAARGQVMPLKGMTFLAGVPAVLLCAALIYGLISLHQPITGREIKVSIIQGNLDPSRIWERGYFQIAMDTMCGLSEKAAADHPELIVWPENSTPRSVHFVHQVAARVQETARKTGAPIILGSSSGRKFEAGGKKSMRPTTSAFLATGYTIMNQRYDKIYRVPFGEYLPYKEYIPWHWIGVPDIVEEAPGNEIKVFDIPGARFSVTICWENMFPELFSRFVHQGAQFMVNITNEAWFGPHRAPNQFVAISVMRAVENRVYVVRSANTGISCIIDPFGRVVDRVRDEAGRDVYVSGFLTGSVVPLSGGSFYTRFGDWFVLLCAIVSGSFLIAAWRRDIWRKGS